MNRNLKHITVPPILLGKLELCRKCTHSARVTKETRDRNGTSSKYHAQPQEAFPNAGRFAALGSKADFDTLERSGKSFVFLSFRLDLQSDIFDEDVIYNSVFKIVKGCLKIQEVRDSKAQS